MMKSCITPFRADYSIEFFRCTAEFCHRCFQLAGPTLLKQAERSTRPTYGFLLLRRQLHELESIAITCAITHDTSDSNWGRCNRNRKLQAHRRANVPSGGKYSRDSAFVDVQRTPSHLTAFDPKNACAQFGFDFVSWVSPSRSRDFGLWVVTHRTKVIFLPCGPVAYVFAKVF